MRELVVYVDKVRWRIHLLLPQSESDIYDLADILCDCGCKGTELSLILTKLKNGNENIGITSTDTDNRNSIVVIGVQENDEELINTMFHECFHVVVHICKTDGIELSSEDAAYIAGDIAGTIYTRIRETNFL